jgi:hypothetical protein
MAVAPPETECVIADRFHLDPLQISRDAPLGEPAPPGELLYA